MAELEAEKEMHETQVESACWENQINAMDRGFLPPTEPYDRIQEALGR